MEREKVAMKVWITKYALTQGIYECEAEVCENINPDMIEVRSNRHSAYYHNEGVEWHKTKEAALEKAEEMRKKKIESLKKQIVKLEKLDFKA